VNLLKTRASTGMAIRRIPEEVPTIHSLHLSPTCRKLAERRRGLVLVTGPTGSGKSTTLAALLDHVNRTRPCHILTMEDPIEFIHREIKAHVTQREVGRDTEEFATALKRALRQDPDVIMVGEMRDLETIGLAVTAAETGHLVFATLHTSSAALTIDRIVDVFPPVQQRQIRMQLADSLQGVIAQVLVPRVGGGVTVAQEVLVATDAVRALIREGKTPQLDNVLQTGSKYGMQTLEDSLNNLIGINAVTVETALTFANVRKRIKIDSAAAAAAATQ
jgi:twitching motility protein PilT